MSRLRIMSTLLGLSLLSVSQANDQKPTFKHSSWGHVSGQVVLKGNLRDPRLQEYFNDLPLARPLALKVPLGAQPEIVHRIPNEQLIVDGKSRGVRNVLVYLKTRPKVIHPDYTKMPLTDIELTLLNRRFTPRVFELQVGQTLVMSSDQITGEPTNFQADLINNGSFNVLVPVQGLAHRWTPKNPEPLPVPIRSTIYPTAFAFFIVKDHPYVAVTDQSGTFEIKNLPAGRHELVLWHETVGYVSKNLVFDVNPNETRKIPPQAITFEQLAR